MERHMGFGRALAAAAALWTAVFGAPAARGYTEYSTETIDGIDWSYGVNMETLTVTLTKVSSNTAVGVVSIPATLGGYPVTRLVGGAFYGCGKMTDVVIPPTVESIADGEFNWCNALESLAIPASVSHIGTNVVSGHAAMREVKVAEDSPFYVVKDGVLYTKDMKTLVGAPVLAELGDLAIPATVERIYGFSMRENESLRSVSVPGSLKDIAPYAFYWCPNLTRATLAEGVETIGNGAFGGTALTNLTLPASTTFIHHNASPVTVAEFRVAADNPAYMARDGVLFSRDGRTLVEFPKARTGEYVVPPGVTHLEDTAFGPFHDLKLTIPEGVESTGYATFERFPEATLALPHSLKSLGTYAFQNSPALEEMELPEGLESIGEGAFYFCKELKRLVVPDSVTSVGNRMLVGCKSLVCLELPGAWDGTDILQYSELPKSLGLVAVYRAKDKDGATWKYRVEKDAAVIVGVAGVPPSGTLEMPKSLRGREVSGVASNALAGVEGLKRLRVPASWEGTAMMAAAGVPEGCAVEYVAAAAQTLDWPPLDGVFASGDRVWLSATASGGDPVEFEVAEGPAFLEGDRLAFAKAGTVRVRARQAGSLRWAPVEKTRGVEVSAVVGGRRISADWAANYAGEWRDASSGGDGFGAWSIQQTRGNGNGWAGCGVWDPSANGFQGAWAGKTRAFGLVGKGEGWAVRASRAFQEPLRPGDAFSLEMALNWDSNQHGAEKGFALTAGGADVLVVNHGSYPGNISLGGDTNHAALNAYGLHPMVWTFTALDARSLRVEATRRDDPDGVFSATLAVSTSAIDGFRLQSAGQNPNDSGADGDKRQSYFDRFRLLRLETDAAGVPVDWLREHAPDILAACGGDAAKAAAATAANGSTVKACWAAGLDPQDPDSDIRFTSFSVGTDGTPAFEWTPGPEAVAEGCHWYILSAATLGGNGDADWLDCTSDPAAATAQGRRFYCIQITPY